jgi:hypothetical protein
MAAFQPTLKAWALTSLKAAGGCLAAARPYTWSSTQRLVLGSQAVDDKSNETTAIPALLERLTLEGALVTIDAIRLHPGHRREDCRTRVTICSR